MATIFRPLSSNRFSIAPAWALAIADGFSMTNVFSRFKALHLTASMSAVYLIKLMPCRALRQQATIQSGLQKVP
jgi:hypothetical protein